jgi:glycosyltransferase involved in cell wall biosynthesis
MTIHAPLFSIIVPTYNRNSMLNRAVASVQAQTQADWELLIADDGSTDHTWRFLSELDNTDARIRCWHHANRGSAASRNRLLHEARAPWVVFLDSDDELEPNHLSLRLEAINQSPNIDVWLSPMRVVGDPFVPCAYTPGKMIHIDNCIAAGMLTIKRDIIMAVGGFPDISYAEDTALFEKLITGSVRTQRLETRTYIYHREHANSLTHERMRNGQPA